MDEDPKRVVVNCLTGEESYADFDPKRDSDTSHDPPTTPEPLEPLEAHVSRLVDEALKARGL